MGNCRSKKQSREPGLTIDDVFKSKNRRNGKRASTPNKYKSSFYFFTEWVLSYRFYNKLSEDDLGVRMLIKMNGPNDINTFKLIKFLDQLEGKDLTNFSNSTSILNSQSNISKPSKQSNFTNPKKNKNTFDIYSNNSKTDEDLKQILVGYIEKLAIENPKKIKKVLAIGPPNNMRWFLWIAMAKANYGKLESQIGLSNEELFNSLVSLADTNLDQEILDMIENDVKNNTFPQLKYFQKECSWSISLKRLLKAIAMYDRGINYCLGMNYLAAGALLVSDGEEIEAFLLLRYFYSSKYGLKLREFYMESSPRLKYYTYCIKILLKDSFNEIYSHMNKLNPEIPFVESRVYCYLQNLYMTILEFTIGVRLLDCLIAYGPDFLIKFTIGFFQTISSEIFKTEDDSQLLELLSTKFEFEEDEQRSEFREKIIKNANNFHISEQVLNTLKKNFKNFRQAESLGMTNRISAYSSEEFSDMRGTIRPSKLNEFNEEVKLRKIKDMREGKSVDWSKDEDINYKEVPNQNSESIKRFTSDDSIGDKHFMDQSIHLKTNNNDLDVVDENDEFMKDVDEGQLSNVDQLAGICLTEKNNMQFHTQASLRQSNRLGANFDDLIHGRSSMRNTMRIKTEHNLTEKTNINLRNTMGFPLQNNMISNFNNTLDSKEKASLRESELSDVKIKNTDEEIIIPKLKEKGKRPKVEFDISNLISKVSIKKDTGGQVYLIAI
ncbi:MAG: TBC domain-containing protein, partial [archaeon]|nr:TBC domain-containing protein [archaeon]